MGVSGSVQVGGQLRPVSRPGDPQPERSSCLALL